MASKGEDKPETKTEDPAPGKKKRPARTIDLKAEEVETADDDTGKPGADGDAPDSAKKTEDATGPQDKGEGEPEQDWPAMAMRLRIPPRSRNASTNWPRGSRTSPQ